LYHVPLTPFERFQRPSNFGGSNSLIPRLQGLDRFKLNLRSRPKVQRNMQYKPDTTAQGRGSEVAPCVVAIKFIDFYTVRILVGLAMSHQP